MNVPFIRDQAAEDDAEEGEWRMSGDHGRDDRQGVRGVDVSTLKPHGQYGGKIRRIN
jgi:hypothetical protein